MTTTHENVEIPAERASRGLLMHFGSTPGAEWELTIESIRKRADTPLEVLERILHRSVPIP